MLDKTLIYPFLESLKNFFGLFLSFIIFFLNELFITGCFITNSPAEGEGVTVDIINSGVTFDIDAARVVVDVDFFLICSTCLL